MRLGMSTGGFIRGPIGDALPLIAGAGVRLLEISTWKPHFDLTDQGQVSSLRGALAWWGLEVWSLHSPFAWGAELGSPDPDNRQAALHMAEAAARVTAMLGGRVLVHHPLEANLPAGDPGLRDRLAWAADSLARVREGCEALGILLAVEGMLPHLAGGRPGELAALTAGLGEAGWGYCLDTSHAALSAEGVVGWIRFMGPRLTLVHASDNRGRDDDHLPPGQGDIDWAQVSRVLAETGYAGPFILELNPAHVAHLDLVVAEARRLLAL